MKALRALLIIPLHDAAIDETDISIFFNLDNTVLIGIKFAINIPCLSCTTIQIINTKQNFILLTELYTASASYHLIIKTNKLYISFSVND